MKRGKNDPLSILAIISLFICLNAQAQITISEDFDYGASAGNLTGNGGSGFAAAWTGGTGAYTATGLSFGALSGTGGAMLVGSGKDAIRQITTGFAAAGPVSGSFLFQLTSTITASSVLTLGLHSTTGANNQQFQLGFLPANDAQMGNPALAVKNGGTSIISAMTDGASLTQGTTYMYVFSYSSNSTSAWILSLSQYNNFFDGTTLDQTTMNAASIGTASTNVTGKVTIAGTPSSTMSYLFSYYFGSGSMTVDRIRMSGTAALSGLGGASYIFNGTTNSDWATASNWSSGVVPTSLSSGDAVVIGANCTMTNVAALSFPSGTSLTVNASTTLTLNGTSAITTQSGAILTNNSTMTVNGTFTNNGTYKGSGMYSGSLFTNPSGGIVNVGNSAGCMTFSNGFTNNGVLQIDVNGVTDNCMQFDKITVTGTATLGGTLAFTFSYGGASSDKASYITATTVSGMFAIVTGIGVNWFNNYEATKATVSYGSVLGVELLNFKATPSVSSVKLDWETANEVNNKGFQIEKIMNNGEWMILGFVHAKSKSSNYDFVDNTPLSINYYRLRQIDNDGKETLSKVVSASLKGKGTLKVYPNPVSNHFTLDVSSSDATDYQIFNLLGKQVLYGKTVQQIDVSVLPQGTYVIKLGIEQAKFVKQ